MELEEGKKKFIEEWGKLGTSWGVSRTMAQVHALLLVSDKPLCTNSIMDELKISRGNAHQNLKSLNEWGLVHKELRYGDRKEYFYAEKDLWKTLKLIIIERKKRELEPMIGVLNHLQEVNGDCPESIEFCNMVKELNHFANKTNNALDTLIKTDSNGLLTRMFTMI
jgi:DNA-binding transcriptional regulator GbsR (MarR family)